MSFTRYYDDPNRIAKSLEQSVFAGQYALGTPGQGLQLPFIDDPQWRLSHFGANLHFDSTNIESDLKGLGKPLSHDYDSTYHQKEIAGDQNNRLPKVYPSLTGPQIEESRATHPAWLFRDLPTKRWETPLLNPVTLVEKPFHDNLQTRILEKDYFRPISIDEKVNESVCRFACFPK